MQTSGLSVRESGRNLTSTLGEHSNTVRHKRSMLKAYPPLALCSARAGMKKVHLVRLAS